MNEQIKDIIPGTPKDNVQNNENPKHFLRIVQGLTLYFLSNKRDIEFDDESENWKYSAEEKRPIIPDEVDEMVKKCFVKQLKKYS